MSPSPGSHRHFHIHMATLSPRHLGAVLLTGNHHCFCTNIYFTDLPMQLSFTEATSHSTPIMYTSPPPYSSSDRIKPQLQCTEAFAGSVCTNAINKAGCPRCSTEAEGALPMLHPLLSSCKILYSSPKKKKKKDAMTGQGGTTYLLQVAFLSRLKHRGHASSVCR